MTETSLLANLLVKIIGDKTDLDKKLSASEESAKKTGANITGNLKSQFGEIDTMLGGIGTKIGKLLTNPLVLAATAVVAVGKAFVDTTKDLAEYGDKLSDMSQQTGLSTDALQEYKFAAEQTGTSLESITSSIKLMTRGLDTNADTFKSLGVNVKDANGNFRDQNDIFSDTITALGSMTNETEQSKIALQLFGRGAQEIVPIIKLGAGGLQELKDKAHSLGVVMSEETIKRAGELKDSTEALGAAWKTYSMSLVQNSIPALQSVSNWITKIIEGMNEQNRIASLQATYAAYKAGKASVIEYHDALKGLMEINQAAIDSDTKSAAQKKLAKQYLAEQTAEMLKAEPEYNKAIAFEKALTSARESANKSIEASKEAKKKDKEAQEAAAVLAKNAAIANAETAQKTIDYQERITQVTLNDALIRADAVAKEAAGKTASEAEFVDFYEAGSERMQKASADTTRASLEYFVKSEQEKQKAEAKTAKLTINDLSTVLSSISSFVSRASQLYQQDAQNKADAIASTLSAAEAAIDAELEAKLKALGLASDTAVESAQKDLDAAVAAGDAKAIAEAQKALARAKLEQEAADKKKALEKQAALDTYAIQKSAFETNKALSKAQAIITSAELAINSYSALAKIPYVGPALGIAAAIASAAYGAAQVAIIDQQVGPSAPSLATGGVASSPTLAMIGDNRDAPEAVIPLTERMFASMGEGILSALASRSRPAGVTEATVASANNTSYNSSRQVVINLGNYIGDDASLRKFERALRKVGQQEDVRVGG